MSGSVLVDLLIIFGAAVFLFAVLRVIFDPGDDN